MDDKTKTYEFKDKESDSSDDFDVLCEEDSESNAAAYVSFQKHESDKYGRYEGAFTSKHFEGVSEKKGENEQAQLHPHETPEKREMLRKTKVLQEPSPKHQQNQENQEVRFAEGTIKDITKNMEKNETLLQKVTPQTRQKQGRAQKAPTSLSLIDREKCLAREKMKAAMLKIIKVGRTQREMDAAIKDKPQNEREKYWIRKGKKEVIERIIESQILERGLGPLPDEPLNEVEIRRIQQILNRDIWRQNKESEWFNVERELLEQEIFQNERDKCIARREIKEALKEILLCEKIQRIMDESKLDDSQKVEEYNRIRKEIEESMWLLTLQNEPERLCVERECIEATEIAQDELEISTIRTEINRAKENILHFEQESDRIRREIERAVQESCDVIQDVRAAVQESCDVIPDVKEAAQESCDVKGDATEALQFDASYF